MVMKKRVYRKKAAKKAPKVSAPLKLAIAKAVKRAAPEEVKFITSWNGQFASADVYGVNYNAYMTGGTNIAIMPPLSLGSAVGARLGNKIHPKRLVVDFWVNPSNYLSSADMVARLCILESKNIKDSTSVSSISLAELLNWGQTQGSFNGYPSHLSAPINTNAFKVYSDRLIKMNKAEGQGPSITNTYTGAVVAPTTNTLHHYRVNVKVPATLCYKDATDTYPEGYAPFFNAAYAILPQTNAADSPDVSITRLQVQWTTTLYYTDA